MKGNRIFNCTHSEGDLGWNIWIEGQFLGWYSYTAFESYSYALTRAWEIYMEKMKCV